MEQALEQLALLRLYFTPGVGSETQKKILQIPNILEKIIQNSSKSFPAHFLSETKTAQLFSEAVYQRASEELEWMQQNQVELLSILDPAYPMLLREAPKAPALLFSKGTHNFPHRIPLAFVGTRYPTHQASTVIERLISELKDYPVVIVSGFAKGVDAITHRLALQYQLPTLGILGTGLDLIYPRENKELFQQMLKGGGFLTEYSTRTEPLAGNFPSRNRIISGLSYAVIVVEAPESSGALITAQFALEQGREVMAVPGSVLSKNHQGCHRLIQQGAKLIQNAKDLLEGLPSHLTLSPVQSELNFSSKSLKENGKDKLQALDCRLPLEPEEKYLFDQLDTEPLHFDQIFQKIDGAPESLSSQLMLLTLKGWVEELPGKFFKKVMHG